MVGLTSNIVSFKVLIGIETIFVKINKKPGFVFKQAERVIAARLTGVVMMSFKLTTYRLSRWPIHSRLSRG